MIGRRPQPLIGKLVGVLFSGKSDPPKTMKRYDLGGGVGLGIVAALENSDFVSHHHKSNKPACITRCQSRPVPVPVDMEHDEEDYTFVTCHDPNKNKTSTRVYYDADHHSDSRLKFYTSSKSFSDDTTDFTESGFLSHCDLCHKNLHGKDIYMYRGEKAFCSTECRYVEIVKDERKEKQRLKSGLGSSRSASTSATSSYNVVTTNGLNFATGIFAT